MIPYHQDDWLTVWQGDCVEVMAQMPAESVHTVVTSPPYWGLRDYGTATWLGGEEGCDHLARTGRGAQNLDALGERLGTGGGHKASSDAAGNSPFRHICGKCAAVRQDSQLGLEPTPEEYVTNMVAVFREVRRVLRADGTCWVNLGDSYASHDPGGYREGEFLNPAGRPPVKGQARNRAGNYRPGGLKPKDLVGIPWRVAFALQADGWYLRSDIVWSKANPMPESVTDRPTKSHEYVFLLSKSPRYYFDSDAVREGLYDVPAGAPADGVPRPTEPPRRVVAMPTMFDGPDVGVEGTEPRPGAGQPATMGGVGDGEGDQETARSVGPQAVEDGRVSPLRAGTRGEPASAAVASGSSSTGAVLPRAADGDGGTIDTDGAGVGGDPDGAGASLSVLRGAEAADDGSRHPVEQGWGAHEGERGGSVPPLQQPEARRVKVPGGWDRGEVAHGTIHRDGRTSAEYQEAVVRSGRNLRSVWHLATQPYPGAHFATFPEKLVEPCVKAGSPEGGTVLDPFAGSGTTGRVAQRLGRRAVLIDLNADYLVQAMKRNSEIPLGLEIA